MYRKPGNSVRVTGFLPSDPGQPSPRWYIDTPAWLNTGMKHHIPTYVFLLIAFACYMVGMALPAAFFMIVGALAEAVFWVRVFRRR
jgi:hypothetical protein